MRLADWRLEKCRLAETRSTKLHHYRCLGAQVIWSNTKRKFQLWIYAIPIHTYICKKIHVLFFASINMSINSDLIDSSGAIHQKKTIVFLISWNFKICNEFVVVVVASSNFPKKRTELFEALPTSLPPTKPKIPWGVKWKANVCVYGIKQLNQMNYDDLRGKTCSNNQ